MAKEPTQKAKLSLKALELTLTKDVTNDYYLMPKLQKCLDMADLAREVAAMSTRQEDEDEIKRIGNLLMKRMVWYLSAGYSLSTVLGYFRPTVNGVLLEPELATAPSRDRIKLGISYSMSQDMRQALAEAELDVEIQKATSGPQLYSVVSAQDALHPDAATRGQGVPVSAGEACIIKGKNLKVGGTDEKIGVTLTRQDGSSKETVFFPVSRLYPNTPTQVGFVMPASASEGSVWSVTLCTQIGSNGAKLLQAPRTVAMPDYFVVGEVSENPGGSGGSGDGNIEENPLE